MVLEKLTDKINTRKGVFIDYNYLVIILVFFVLFTTGITLASDQVEGIEEFTGVTPPTEIEACNWKDIEGDLWYQKGTDAWNWDYGRVGGDAVLDNVEVEWIDEGDPEHLHPDEPTNFIQLEDPFFSDVTEGTYTEIDREVLAGRPGNFNIPGNVAVNQIRLWSYTPENTELELLFEYEDGENASQQWSYTVEYENRDDDGIGEYVIDAEDIVLEDGSSVVVQDDVEITFTLRRDDGDDVSPRLNRARFYGELVDYEEGFISSGVNMGRCVIAQVLNLFNIITFRTGYMWIDLVLIPFQIVLLFFIVKIVIDAVSGLPFT